MNKRDLEKLKEELEKLLNEKIGSDLNYKIDDTHENNMSIIKIDIDIKDEDYPEDWDKDVEDVVSYIVREWGGTFCWDSWILYISIPD